MLLQSRRNDEALYGYSWQVIETEGACAVRLRRLTRQGLSLADRVCLALALEPMLRC